jgi:molecular chaperone GrpE
MNQDQPLENVQPSAAENSQNLEQVEQEVMSAEANLQTENEQENPGVPMEPAVGEVVEASLDEEEPFDLSPEPAPESATDAAADPAQVRELTATIDALKAQLDDRAAQVEDITNQQKRLAADFDNYRRRTDKEKEDLEVRIKIATINELLSVVDNFERARSQIKPQGDGEMNIHKSYQGIYKQLVDSLKRVGVSPMRAEGQEFDPNLHEAVMREPTSEFPEGVVMEELVRGYLMGDRVLRHALVKVAAPPEDGDDVPADTQD